MPVVICASKLSALSRSLVRIRTRLNVPNFTDPALPIRSLALREGMVPPVDGGLAVGDYLARGLEITSAAVRWREVCYAAATAAKA